MQVIPIRNKRVTSHKGYLDFEPSKRKYFRVGLG